MSGSPLQNSSLTPGDPKEEDPSSVLVVNRDSEHRNKSFSKKSPHAENEGNGEENEILIDTGQRTWIGGVKSSRSSVAGVAGKDSSIASVPSQATEVKVKKRNWKNHKYTGILLTLLSAIMFSSVGIVVKFLKGYHVLNLAAYRFVGMTILSMPPVVYEQCMEIKRNQNRRRGQEDNDENEEGGMYGIFTPIWPLNQKDKLTNFSILFGRAVIGYLAVTLYFSALKLIPIADAQVIGACSAVFVAIGAHIFLKERCGIFPVLSAILIVAGVTVISRPPILTGNGTYNWDTLTGTLFALGRMVFTSVAIMFVRYLRGLNASLIVFLIGILQLLLTVITAFALGVLDLMPRSSRETWLFLLLGILSYSSQMTLTLALKCEQAGPFAIIRTSSDTLFAFLLQFIFLGVEPDIFSGVGAAIILLAVFLTVFRKWVTELPDDNPNKERYAFILK